MADITMVDGTNELTITRGLTGTENSTNCMATDTIVFELEFEDENSNLLFIEGAIESKIHFTD